MNLQYINVKTLNRNRVNWFVHSSTIITVTNLCIYLTRFSQVNTIDNVSFRFFFHHIYKRSIHQHKSYMFQLHLPRRHVNVILVRIYGKRNKKVINLLSHLINCSKKAGNIFRWKELCLGSNSVWLIINLFHIHSCVIEMYTIHITQKYIHMLLNLYFYFQYLTLFYQ